jgi:hypothetical protein
MPIDDKIVKDWGTIYPGGLKDHITIPNGKPNDVHITTRLPGDVTIRQNILPNGDVGNPIIK